MAVPVVYTQAIMAKHGKKKRALPALGTVRAMPAASRAESPDADLRRGLTAFEQDDYGEAIRTWREVRRAGAAAKVLDKALAEAYFRRALATENQGRRAQDLQEAVALAPDRAIYHFHRGLAHQRQGQIRRAREAYIEAHRLAPADARIGRQLALALLVDPATAEQAADVLASIPARDEGAARLRSSVYLRANHPTEALLALGTRKAASPIASLALGLAQLAAGDSESALMAFDKVKRSRTRLSAAVRQAAALASVVAQARAGDRSVALAALLRQQPPADARLRSAFAAVGRWLAAEFVLEERFEEAINAWEKILAATPDDAAIQRCLAHIHEVLGTRALRAGDFAVAAEQWQAALLNQAANPSLLRNLALAEERLERWQPASAHWEELIRQWSKELGAARRDEQAATELRTRLAAADRHLAGTYEFAGDRRAAGRTLRLALDLAPFDLDLRLHAAELSLENEDYTAAIEHLRQVLAERPTDTRVLLDLGSAYDLKGDDRRAQSHLEQALALEPQNPAITTALAGVHHGRGHRLAEARMPERAVPEFQRASTLSPLDPEHDRCLGAVYLDLGQLDLASVAFSGALALRLKDPRLRVAIGDQYLAHGHPQEADRLFRQALRLGGGASVPLAIGLVYLRQGDVVTACQYFDRLLKKREPGPLSLIGTSLLEVQQHAAAIPYLERSLSLQPWNISAHLDLALAYMRGRADYARSEAELSIAERQAAAMEDHATLDFIASARAALDLVRASARPLAGAKKPAGQRYA